MLWLRDKRHRQVVDKRASPGAGDRCMGNDPLSILLGTTELVACLML